MIWWIIVEEKEDEEEEGKKIQPNLRIYPQPSIQNKSRPISWQINLDNDDDFIFIFFSSL